MLTSNQSPKGLMEPVLGLRKPLGLHKTSFSQANLKEIAITNRETALQVCR
jgi:hypothetical protein